MSHVRTLALALSAGALLTSSCDYPTGGPDPFERASARTTAPDPLLAELGDLIFDDEDLSIGRNQSCAACHDAEWGFTGPIAQVNAHGAVYEGSIPGRFGDRKPPSSAYSTQSPVLFLGRDGFVGGSFWDGRATGEKLGSPAADQAQGPFLNPLEQALPDAACVVHRVAQASYAAVYVQVWGPSIQGIPFPANTDDLCGQEGSTVPLDAAARAGVDLEFDRIAIAIAAYEASTEHNPLFTSKFDAWRRGQAKLTKEEQRGFALFQGRAGCARCHPSQGQQPLFTDFTYDNLGFPPNPENPALVADPSFVDRGLGGFLLSAGFGDWEEEVGKVKVPTLRNVDLRPADGQVKAFGHNGYFKSLESIVHFYNTRDVLPDCAAVGAPDEGVNCWPAPEVAANVNRDELGDLGLTVEEEHAVVAFLKTLSDGHFVPRR